MLPLRVVQQQSDVQNPPLGGGSQGIAPEFYWRYDDLAVTPPPGTDWALMDPTAFRPATSIQETQAGHVQTCIMANWWFGQSFVKSCQVG